MKTEVSSKMGKKREVDGLSEFLLMKLIRHHMTTIRDAIEKF